MEGELPVGEGLQARRPEAERAGRRGASRASERRWGGAR